MCISVIKKNVMLRKVNGLRENVELISVLFLSDNRRSDNTSHAGNEVTPGQENPTSNNNAAATAGEGPSSPPTTGEIGQFPLAVKLVFNYEAASNAPAILSALYRELLPARTLQLDATYDHWRLE